MQSFKRQDSLIHPLIALEAKSNRHDKDCRGVVKTINTLLDGSDVSCNGRFLQFAKWNCREKIAALNTALNGGE